MPHPNLIVDIVTLRPGRPRGSAADDRACGQDGHEAAAPPAETEAPGCGTIGRDAEGPAAHVGPGHTAHSPRRVAHANGMGRARPPFVSLGQMHHGRDRRRARRPPRGPGPREPVGFVGLGVSPPSSGRATPRSWHHRGTGRRLAAFPVSHRHARLDHRALFVVDFLLKEGTGSGTRTPEHIVVRSNSARMTWWRLRGNNYSAMMSCTIADQNQAGRVSVRGNATKRRGPRARRHRVRIGHAGASVPPFSGADASILTIMAIKAIAPQVRTVAEVDNRATAAAAAGGGGRAAGHPRRSPRPLLARSALYRPVLDRDRHRVRWREKTELYRVRVRTRPRADDRRGFLTAGNRRGRRCCRSTVRTMPMSTRPPFAGRSG